MKFRLLDEAFLELEQAVDYYNLERLGLGDEFSDEVVRSIERIAEYPSAWQSVSNRTRRCITRRFPYGIIYQLREDELLIVSIFHLHRKPDDWLDRIS